MSASQAYASAADRNDATGMPASVPVVGRVWLFVGVVLALAALAGAAVHALVAASDPDFDRLAEGFPGLAPLARLIESYHWIAAAQILAAAAAVGIARAFLRVRPWARAAMAGVHYASLAALAAFTLWWVAAFWSARGAGSAVALFAVIAAVPGFAVVAGLLWRGLRAVESEAVRAHFSGRPGASADSAAG